MNSVEFVHQEIDLVNLWSTRNVEIRFYYRNPDLKKKNTARLLNLSYRSWESLCCRLSCSRSSWISVFASFTISKISDFTIFELLENGVSSENKPAQGRLMALWPPFNNYSMNQSAMDTRQNYQAGQNEVGGASRSCLCDNRKFCRSRIRLGGFRDLFSRLAFHQSQIQNGFHSELEIHKIKKGLQRKLGRCQPTSNAGLTIKDSEQWCK